MGLQSVRSTQRYTHIMRKGKHEGNGSKGIKTHNNYINLSLRQGEGDKYRIMKSKHTEKN